MNALFIPLVLAALSGGWFAHKLYVKSMWRVERAARHRAQGRR